MPVTQLEKRYRLLVSADEIKFYDQSASHLQGEDQDAPSSPLIGITFYTCISPIEGYKKMKKKKTRKEKAQIL